MKRNQYFSKYDILLLIIIVLISLSGMVFFAKNTRSEGNYLRVTINGRLYGEYELTKDRDISITLNQGKNTIRIQEGTVSMITADCPDQYCVMHAPIHQERELIVCLPHKLVLEIYNNMSEASFEIDGITQ